MIRSIASSNDGRGGQGDDRDPRDHDLVEAPVAELDDRVDHLLLLGLEDPLLAAALDDQPQLLGGDLGLGRDVGAERARDRARRRGQQGDDRAGRCGRGCRPVRASPSANASGWASASVLGTSSPNTIVNSDSRIVTTSRPSDAGVARAHADVDQQVGEAGREAHAGERRGEEADERDGRAGSTARNRPGSLVRRRTRAGTAAALVDASAPRGSGGATRARSRRRRSTPFRRTSRTMIPSSKRVSPIRRRRPRLRVRTGRRCPDRVSCRRPEAGLADAGRHADGELARGARPWSRRRRRRSRDPSPSVTGARSIVSTPRNTPSPIVVRCLDDAVVVGGDRAGARRSSPRRPRRRRGSSCGAGGRASPRRLFLISA